MRSLDLNNIRQNILEIVLQLKKTQIIDMMTDRVNKNQVTW